MLAILSPAKNMSIANKNFIDLSKDPVFLEQTLKIHKKIKELQPFEIESIMKVNPEIALNTFLNFQDFEKDKQGALAILAYNGLVFKNLNSSDFSSDDLIFADETIRILSGFYGILKPCDNILPYRLEMQCKLSFGSFKNLYKFWDNLIYKELFKDGKTIVNLASDEYTKTITPFIKQKDKFVNINFCTLRNGKLKTIPTSAKALRGQMARFIVKNKIKSLENLKNFEFDGYIFDEYLSNEMNYTFKK